MRSGALVIARRHIVNDGVAEDVTLPVRGGDAATSLPDDKGELGFVIRNLGHFWKNNIVAGADDGGRELVKDSRDVGDFRARLDGVVAIIQPHADQFPRPWDRGHQLDAGERHTRRGRRSTNELFDAGEAFFARLDDVQHRGKALRRQIKHDIRARNDPWADATLRLVSD